jgi:hypothetical protein
MKQTFLIVTIFILHCLISNSQVLKDISRKDLLKSIEYSNPSLIIPPTVKSPGFPDRSPGLDVLPGFKNPPPGYGEVPFWWWSGDPLDKGRLLWQMEELHKKGITGMQINYIHKDSPGWPTYPAEPEIFSGKWWEMWKYAADEAGKRSMGIGMSGYTIDWPKSDNLFNKLIYSIPEIQGIELLVDTIIRLSGGAAISKYLSENTLQVWVYPVKDGKLIPGGYSLSSNIRDQLLEWKPTEGDWEIWIYKTKRIPGTLNPIHPLSGKTVIDKFFQPFEDHTTGKTSEGLNYFFQDELKFGVGDLIWTDDLNKVFKEMKGYDLFETLPGMFKNIGPITAKARLDFMDVKVRLSEERYFIPIFDWHWSRGKIYGCDPEGRGKEPGAYGNNFQVIRWYTAPGHDTPNGKADLIKGKVSSSIAALYQRPRVWLEGYHSLGWGATPEQIMYATNENFLYGCNLLNLHGLYYTTHGSYWEWAPPCYHFRMPYWDHMTIFLKYFERLSYLLSQGTLKTDIAILYPVSTAQAGLDEEKATSLAFKSGTDLFNKGYDFLFIDDQSLVRAEIADGELNVSDLSFKVLILPSLSAIRWSTLKRAQEFFRNGGTVIAAGSLPETSDHAGALDPSLDNIVRELFGVSASGMKKGEKPSMQINESKGMSLFVEDSNELIKKISRLLGKHVYSDYPVKYMHRKVGFSDVFMVMGAPKNSWCTFNSTGTPELWDPWTGETHELSEIEAGPGFIRIKMPNDTNEAQIIVFTPPSPVANAAKRFTLTDSSVISLDDDWEFELKPTMDNRWGDFRLPVKEETIGAEGRIFRYAEEKANPKSFMQPGFDDSKWEKVTYGFGQKFWKLGPLPDNIDKVKVEQELAALNSIDQSKPILINDKVYFWTPYSFSWRYGFEGDPGHEGYHGLKEEITDEFICLGKPTAGLNETLYKQEKEGSVYFLWTSAFSQNVTNVTIDANGLIPASLFIEGKRIDYSSNNIRLQQGSNPLLIRYDKPGRGHFVVLKENNIINNTRTPLSMKWWNMSGRIAFDSRPSEKTPAGWYRFVAPPGLKSMTIRINGKLKIWVDGKLQKTTLITYASAPALKVEMDNIISRKSIVAMRVDQIRGEYNGEAFPEPVLISCDKGIVKTGDWSVGSVLENYSGGAWYRKKIMLTEQQLKSDVLLDLGKVVATAEIHVNDSLVRILVTSPWKVNISKWIRKGENKIEILVYNTLANHYLTIPTKYGGGSLKSGLLGPVKLEFKNLKPFSE